MTFQEVILVVVLSITLRVLIQDNITYFLTCLFAGAILGILSGLVGTDEE